MSNVTSRARDEVPGGTDDTPSLPEDEDIPQVAMERGEPVPPPTEAPARDPAPVEPAPGTETPAPSPPVPEESPPDLTRLPTGQLFAQPSGGERGRNARLPGDISLNTTAWAYAPWLRAFRQRFEKHWIVPFGYRAGLIDGYTTVRAEIAKSGELVALEVVDEGGHTALRGASVTSFRSASPYPPLPEDFPEPTLIMEIKLSYPRYPR